MLKVSITNSKNLHIVPENITSCQYSGGDTLLINDNTISNNSDLCFIGQVVGDKIHLTPVKSATISAYREKQERQSESSFLPVVIAEESENEDTPQETIIQQSVRRNVMEPSKDKVKWTHLEIIEKDMRDQFVYHDSTELKVNQLNFTAISKNQKGLQQSYLERPLLDTLAYSKITTFSLLLENYDMDELLEELPSIGILVNGTWIIQSQLMYEEQMNHARNYLLYLFQTKPLVKRSDLAELMSLDNYILFNLFSEIASKHEGGWKLKCEPDVDFLKAYPKLVMEQEQKLKEMAKQAQEYFIPSSSADSSTKTASKITVGTSKGQPIKSQFKPKISAGKRSARS